MASLINSNLVLEDGPLSYAYRLYKVEFHHSDSNLAYNDISQQQNDNITIDIKSHDNNLEASDVAEKRISESLARPRRSEHLINGRDFDGEIQLHFYNQLFIHSAEQARQIVEDQYTSEKGSESNLFAAISILLERKPEPEAKTNHHHSGTNTDLSDFLKILIDARDAKRAQIHHLAFKKTLFESLITTKSEYVTYQGSLNRPPCTENVDWILLNRALKVSGSLFDRLFGSNPSLNQDYDNVRPVKPRFNRLLRTSINVVARSPMADVQILNRALNFEPKVSDCYDLNCASISCLSAESINLLLRALKIP